MNAQQHFERNKNVQALALTAGICGALLLLFVFVSWTLPVTLPPVQDEGVEVNLGNSEQGLGDIAPQAKEAPSATAETDVQPPKAVAAQAEPEETKEVAPNDEKDAATINTSPKPEHKPKPEIIEKTVTKKQREQPVIVSTPAPPKPKALYSGGTSNKGGNDADSYNGIKNQGIAGGKGDQGKPNGNPNSDSYTGNGGSGKSGVTIRSGLTGRRLARLPSFTDDFNENAKVAVDITVDRNGTVTAAAVNPRGTTTTNGNIRSIAVTKAKQLKLNAGSVDEQTGTIVFDFKLRN